MIDALKRLVPLGAKQHVRAMLDRESVDLPDGPRAFLFLAADYGNIGDIAITAAQEHFLRRHSGRSHVVVVPISKTRIQLRAIREQIAPGDLVAIVGGGNMGGAYPDIEALRQRVIQSFPDNRIVCFPQTLDWHGHDSAIRALVKVYSGHNDLHVFARESVSRDKLAELFAPHPGVTVGWVPDIVLSATASDLGATPARERSGILMAMRDDQERAITDAQRRDLDAALAATGMAVAITDTHAGGSGLSEAERSELLREKVEQFGAARLVVTDRLHGMIMAIVANTPVLVLPNANHKIRQTHHDWLRASPTVDLIAPDQMGAVAATIERLMAAASRPADTAPMDVRAYADLRTAVSAP